MKTFKCVDCGKKITHTQQCGGIGHFDPLKDSYEN